MSVEKQIFDYIVDNANLREDLDAQEELADEINDALSDVIIKGVSKSSDYFELYRSSNGNFYWYVFSNTDKFRRWIVTDISKLNVLDIKKSITENKIRALFLVKQQQNRKKAGKLTAKSKLSHKAKAVVKAVFKRSDARCKEIIECVNTINGVNIYEWRWLDVPKTPIHLVGCTGVGVIAQELLQSFPECVIEDSDGWLSVDYDMLYAIIL